jgi:hypothetical protein
MNKANYTFRCPHCETMNLPDAQFCGHCARAIGDQSIEQIRKRKIDFVLLGMEMDYRILDDCFQIVLRKMLQDDLFMMERAKVQEQGTDAGAHQNSQPHPRKRGRKPKDG